MRLLATLLLVSLGLALAACGGSSDPYQRDREMALHLQAG